MPVHKMVFGMYTVYICIHLMFAVGYTVFCRTENLREALFFSVYGVNQSLLDKK